MFKLAIPAIIIVLLFSGYKIYVAKIKGLEADLKIEKINAETLVKSLGMQSNVIKRQSNDIQILDSNFKKMTSQYAKMLQLNEITTSRIKELESKFHKRTVSGKKRNFSKLANRKPGLISTIINNASANAMRCIEIASGSTIEKENDKKTCPHLFN